MTRPVRTRFAPSPTGYMHIGGMRTALFAWLWARHTGGTFILRIDDTDQERNVEAALGPIFRAFEWLGLNWDEGPKVGGSHEPYYQSQRNHLYRAAVEKLMAGGLAYKDFDPPELIAEDRKKAEAAKQTYINVRRSLELTNEERSRLEAEGKPYVVRFLIPRDQKIAIDDAVRGHVEWDCSLMPDPVIMRSNGSFLYNFATVVDDAQMEITHIIRAEEHLANTPVQALIHKALENPMPVFAHIPFITAPGSTKKLSKRDIEKMRTSPQLKKMFERADVVLPQIGITDSKSLNPVMVEYYERLGYLPAGILNALSRLGWSLDGSTEHLSLNDVVQNFTLERIVKAPAGFDPEKLQAFQQHWMNQLSPDEKIDGCLPFLQAAGYLPNSIDEATRSRLRTMLVAIADRLRIFSDILDYSEFLVADDQIIYDEKAFQQRLRDAGEAAGLLRQLHAEFSSLPSFDAAALDKLVHEFVERNGIKISQVVHALRLATTGKTAGIGLFEAMALLGRESTLNRLQLALNRI